ncbi:MAG: YfbU family protein [Polaribacter sp.]
MIPKTLTITERQILANQFRILSRLENETEHYEKKAEIVENGFTGQYGEVFEVDQEEMEYNYCIETHDILNMFRYISNAIQNLTKKEKESLDLNKLTFEGFDGNNDEHYHYTSFMIEKQGKWKEHDKLYLNSHNSMTISNYRKMLPIYKKVIDSKRFHLNFEDLNELILVQ